MRKILSLLILICLFSCAKKEEPKTFKDVAMEYLASEIDYRLPHGEEDKPEISELEDVLVDDSAYSCVFSLKTKNLTNRWIRVKMTYACVLLNDGKKQVTLIYENLKPIIEMSAREVDEFEKDAPHTNAYKAMKRFGKMTFYDLKNHTREVE